MEMIRGRDIKRECTVAVISDKWVADHSVSESFPKEGEVFLRWVEPSCLLGRVTTAAGWIKSSAGKSRTAAGRPETTWERGKLIAGNAKTAEGRLENADGRDKREGEALKLRIDGLNCQMSDQIAGGADWLWVLETYETICQLSTLRVYVERSVIAEQKGNRFLSSFGMTENITTRNWQRRTSLLTIKYYNSPTRRIASMTKNAHLSEFNHLCFKRAILQLTMVNADTTTMEYSEQSERIRHLLVSSVVENMGTGDNKLFPFFLVSSSSFGGNSRLIGTKRCGTVANENKTNAYET